MTHNIKRQGEQFTKQGGLPWRPQLRVCGMTGVTATRWGVSSQREENQPRGSTHCKYPSAPKLWATFRYSWVPGAHKLCRPILFILNTQKNGQLSLPHKLLLFRSHPGLQSKFHNSESYAEKSCLEKKTTNFHLFTQDSAMSNYRFTTDWAHHLIFKMEIIE